MVADDTLHVLIVDADEARAQQLGVILRFAGCTLSFAKSLAADDEAARCDAIFVDDDGASSTTLRELARRGRDSTAYRVVAVAWSRFADVRGSADYVIAKPLMNAVLVDVVDAARLARARRKRLAGLVVDKQRSTARELRA